MLSETKKCIKCKGTMDKGKLMSPKFQRWIKGKPMTIFSALKGDNVYTYRCRDCGYLESYV